MTAAALLRLADALESGFISNDDMPRWASVVRAHAKAVERSVLVVATRDRITPPAKKADKGAWAKLTTELAAVVAASEEVAKQQWAAAEFAATELTTRLDNLLAAVEDAQPVQCGYCGQDTDDYDTDDDEYQEACCQPCKTKFTEAAALGRQNSMDAHDELWPAADVYSFVRENLMLNADDEPTLPEHMPYWFKVAYEGGAK